MFKTLRDSVALRLAGLSLGLAAGILLADPPKAARQTDEPPQARTAKPDSDRLAEAGRLFEKNCISCHRPPDMGDVTDRAWLDQINRTA